MDTLPLDYSLPATLAAECERLRKLMGAPAETFIGVSAAPGRNYSHLSVFPEGMSKGGSMMFDGETWVKIIAQAEAWIIANRTIHRDATIRKMALAIIELTDEFGKCEASVLARKGFERDTIAELHALACERALEMCANAPFSVSFPE